MSSALVEVQWQLYRSDIVSTINEMMLRADLFDNSATGYNYRVAARNIKGFGSPTVAQTTSGRFPYQDLYHSKAVILFSCSRIHIGEGNL